MAIILDYELKHDETHGYYRDYSKYFNMKIKNENKSFNMDKNKSQLNTDDLNKLVNSKIDKAQNLNIILTQKICYNDIYYQKIVYGNSMSLGIMY